MAAALSSSGRPAPRSDPDGDDGADDGAEGAEVDGEEEPAGVAGDADDVRLHEQERQGERDEPAADEVIGRGFGRHDPRVRQRHRDEEREDRRAQFGGPAEPTFKPDRERGARRR